jgi:phosphopantothenoylcysteine decarboxylase/phosphopantothenate--cysteine ligase
MPDLDGWRVLVTAGGTREPIDPVRYLGNRSSGKMGNAIAEAAAARGAEVTLVSTVAPPQDCGGCEVVPVETAAEMASVVWERAGSADVVVMAAAVADFRPLAPQDLKLNREDGLPVIELEPTPDILQGVVANSDAFVVGFSAETGDMARAHEKAKRKGVDLMVANDVLEPGSGFGTDTNTVIVIFRDGSSESWPQMPKREVAERLWDVIRQARSQPR